MNNLTNMYLNDGLFANVCQDFAARHIKPLKDGMMKEHDWLIAEGEKTCIERLQHENIELAQDLCKCMAERDELQAAYDEFTRIAAELCRACGFSMIDASGEVI